MTERTPVRAAEIGALIRTRRKRIGITQAKLAAMVGVSFQQMQKYEKGTNAIGPDRLDKICHLLGLPADYFSHAATAGERAPAASQGDQALSPERTLAFITSGEGRRLIDAFLRIDDRQLRSRILDFIVAVATDAKPWPEPGGPATDPREP